MIFSDDVKWIIKDWWHCTKLYWRWSFNLLFVCPRKGHDYYPDMCMAKEHDICIQCDYRREDEKPLTFKRIREVILRSLEATFEILTPGFWRD